MKYYFQTTSLVAHASVRLARRTLGHASRVWFSGAVVAVAVAAMGCSAALAQTVLGKTTGNTVANSAGLTAAKNPGINANSILLGQSIYLSGPLGALGRDFNAGANLYFDKLNAEGGVNGRKIVVKTLDDAYVPDTALKNAQALVDEHNVFALFQFAGTGSVAKVAPFVQERAVPLCAAVATGPELRSKLHSQIFYVRAGNQEETQAIFQQLQTISRDGRIGVLYLDVAYGKEVLAALEKITASLPGTRIVAAPIAVGADRSVALEKAVKTVMDSNPQAIILATAGKASVSVARELANYRIEPGTVYGLAASFTASELQSLNQQAKGIIISQIVPSPKKASSRLATEFVTAANKQGVPLSFAALEGWLNAKVCSAALGNAGTTPSRASFVKSLERLNIDAGGIQVQFSPARHGGSRFVELTMVGEGGVFLH